MTAGEDRAESATDGRTDGWRPRGAAELNGPAQSMVAGRASTDGRSTRPRRRPPEVIRSVMDNIIDESRDYRPTSGACRPCLVASTTPGLGLTYSPRRRTTHDPQTTLDTKQR